MLNIPCVIFAGGKSSRMGEDKSLLPFGAFTTLTEYQYSRLSKIFSNVYISCKTKKKFHFQAQFIEDSKESDVFAPTLGFVSTFSSLRENRFFALSVDAPFVDEEIINTLVEADNELSDATIAKSDNGIEPLCGIYHRSLENEFIAMQKSNNHKLRFLLKKSNTHYLDFNEKIKFSNLNNPNEYKEALENISN